MTGRGRLTEDSWEDFIHVWLRDRVYCQQCKRHSAHGKKIASKHAHEQLKVSVGIF